MKKYTIDKGWTVSVKPRRWWWPPDRRKAQQMAAFTALLAKENNVIETVNEKLKNIMIYGTEEKPE